MGPGNEQVGEPLKSEISGTADAAEGARGDDKLVEAPRPCMKRGEGGAVRWRTEVD